MKKNLRYILVFFILFSSRCFLYSQPGAIIYSEKTSSDSVDFGMCLKNEYISHNFIIKNTGDRTLRIGANDLTFSISQLPGHPFEFFEFKEVGSKTQDILPGEQKSLEIRYTANSSITSPGLMTCRFRLGVHDPAQISMPTNDSQLVKYRDFVIMAHKATHAIEGFEKVISFDSVWVSPADTQRRYWTVQNNSKYQQSLQDLVFDRYPFSKINHYITPPVNFESGAKSAFLITYYPKSRTDDRGRDTARITMHYIPNTAVPDSSDSVAVSIHGVGVEQKLDIISVDENAVLQGNTVVVNDVPAGEFRDIKIAVQNNGNLPFGIKYQKIYDMGNDKPADGLSIQKAISTFKNLLPTEIDTIIIRFQPSDRNSIYGRYLIGSDIFTRHIHGLPDSAGEVVFFIRGIGVAPEIALAKDTVDFGNIIVNKGDCPAFRDSLVNISNNGNLFLRVKTILLDPPYPATPFNVLNENLDIPPKSSRSLRLRFEPIADQAKNYTANLIMISNSKVPKDTIRIKLSAMGINPDTTNMIIPNIRSKPGRRISIPILANKEKIKIARSYTDTIYFDKSLLKFYNLKTKETASEYMTQTDVSETIEGGKIYIHLGSENNRTFEQKDTLVLMEFDTFMGDKISTPIYFSDSKFGDGICQNVLSTQIKNGLFSLDSICGLENKISKLPKGKFNLEVQQLNTNPDFASVFFSTPFDERIEITVYNSFGVAVYQLANENFAEGSYIRDIPLSDLIPGAYYCVMKAGIFISTKSILISK